jgi:hypothetical protein
MNNLLKRKITDALQLNNIYKKFKSTKPTNNLDYQDDYYHNTHNTHNNTNKKRRSKNKNHQYNQNITHHYANVNNSLNNPFSQHIPNRKEQIPKRIREMVWNTHNGEKYSSKCYVSWCNNIINVFNYQVGHDIPESKGGTLDLSNLKPICGNCNLSMGNKYTITEWCTLINKNTLPVVDIKNIENINTKALLQSQLNILKNSKIYKSKTKNNKNTDANADVNADANADVNADVNTNAIITKSLQQIEYIIDSKDYKDNEISHNTTSYNKFAVAALLMVILNIICF